MAGEQDPHRLEMTALMTPGKASFSGKVHGGASLNLLDRVAVFFASRFSKQYAVALSVDQVKFKEPIQVGELVTFPAWINHTGPTSMGVSIRDEAEDVLSGLCRHNNCSYSPWRPLTMSAVPNCYQSHPSIFAGTKLSSFAACSVVSLRCGFNRWQPPGGTLKEPETSKCRRSTPMTGWFQLSIPLRSCIPQQLLSAT
jgi:acyl-CoA hydrolase